MPHGIRSERRTQVQVNARPSHKLAKRVVYIRKLSADEVAGKYISVLKSELRKFPSLGEPFTIKYEQRNFRVNVESGAFRCFSCDAKGGDIIAYVMLRHDLDFREALESIADAWGVNHG